MFAIRILARARALSLPLMVGLWVAAAQSHAQAPAVRTVQVTAERFSFTPSEVSIAVGDEVDFRLKSEDTAHGFRILGQPIDVAIPKRGRGEIVVRFAPPRAGTYIFECSRMCGAGHSFMRGTINVKDVPEVRSR